MYGNSEITILDKQAPSILVLWVSLPALGTKVMQPESVLSLELLVYKCNGQFSVEMPVEQNQLVHLPSL